MRCENVLDLLLDERNEDSAVVSAAEEHLAGCPGCRDARYAVERLRALRTESIPGPTPGALERALAAATRPAPPAAGVGDSNSRLRRLQPVPGRRSSSAASSSGNEWPTPTAEPGETRRTEASRRGRAGFWVGMGLGASLAAAVALAWLTVLDPQESVPSAATPEVTLALNETRDVSIAVDAPAALPNAEIHVVLTGAIGLAGFDGQRELRWRTNLEAGNNQLTLPVVAFGSRGQLLVEVQHGEKRRTFVVDVRGREA